MQSPFKDKLAYSYPCKTSQTCMGYEDYDPCESNEDITEKDLVVLLKEEAAKLEREKKKPQAAEAESDKKVKPSSGADDKQKQLLQTDDADFVQEEENGEKKKSCKYTENPFFTNKLKLSTSYLLLSPPEPPQQHCPLPTDNESSIKVCQRKQKKCKKNDKTRKPISTISDKAVKTEKNDEDKDDVNRKVDGQTDGEVDGEPCEDTHKSKLADHKIKDTGKKNCKKSNDEKQPLCKKKELEVSLTNQSQKIAFQQKDFPENSPKNTPELEHQVVYAQSKKEDCKKKCKRKDKVK